MKTLNLTLSALTAVALLTGCGGGGGGGSATPDSNVADESLIEAVPQEEIREVTLQNGRFIDASVKGLGFSCLTSGLSDVTDINGIFTCNVGEAVAFYIADNHIGTVLTQEIVTPYTLFPNNQTAAINLAQLLQTLDSDGNPDNGIDLDFERLSLLQGAELNMQDENFDDAMETLLGESLVNESAARQHLNATLGLNGFEENPSEIVPEIDEISEVEEGEILDGASAGVEELVPADEEEPEMVEEDDAPIGEGILPADDEEADASGESGSSSSSNPWFDPDQFNTDAITPIDAGSIDWGAFTPASSSSSEASSSSSGFGFDLDTGLAGTIGDQVSLPQVTIPDNFEFYRVDNFKSSTITAQMERSLESYNGICRNEFGENAAVADKAQIERLQELGADMEALGHNLNFERNIISVNGDVSKHILFKEYTNFIYPHYEEGSVVISYGALADDGTIEISGNSIISTPSTMYPVTCYVPSH